MQPRLRVRACRVRRSSAARPSRAPGEARPDGATCEPGPGARSAGGQQLPPAVGTTKGGLSRSIWTPRPTCSGEFKKLVVREQNGALVRLDDVADVVLGADTYDRTCVSPATARCSWASGCSPTPTRSTSSLACREVRRRSRESAEGLPGDLAFDSTEYINSAIHEVVRTLIETFIVIVVIFLFLGSLRRCSSRRRHPRVAHRRGVSHAGLRVHPEPSDAPRDRSLGGLVVDDAIVVVEIVERHIREGKTPFQAALLAPANSWDRVCHDDHARRRLRTHRLPGRSHRRALFRVRLHARRGSLHLGRRGPHAVADDVLAPAHATTRTRRASPISSTRRSTSCATATSVCCISVMQTAGRCYS